jgi:hypothetical protein
LCRSGQEKDAAIGVLCDGLQSEDVVTRLYAAITLVAVGESAKQAIEPMRLAMEREPNRGTYSLYIHWALQYALRELSES